jgi:hypothetical protein
MMPEIDMFFPYCNEFEELYYRVVLIEKFAISEYDISYKSHFLRCCTINGVAVFKDTKHLTPYQCVMGINGMGNKHVRCGNHEISITTDSSVIQAIVKSIHNFAE